MGAPRIYLVAAEPSGDLLARETAEAVRRARKLARKRAQREGLLPKKGRGKR